jgi:hypothetical protein
MAMVAMLLMLLTGTVFLSLATTQLSNAKRDLNALKAISLAEGGVNYVMWSRTTLNIPATVANSLGNLRLLAFNSGTQITPNTGDNTNLISYWIGKYPDSSTDGYQIVAIGSANGYKRCVRAVFQGDAAGSGSGSLTTETQYFARTFHTNSNFAFDSGCTIVGSGQVNGNLTVTGGGTFGRSDHTGGDIAVGGDFTMSGGATMNGMVSVHGNSYLQNGGALAGGLNGLGSVTVSNTGAHFTNITVNGNAVVHGGNIDGPLKVGGNFSNDGWGSIDSGVYYGGSYTNNKQQFTHTKTVLPQLPASTGAAVPIPTIDTAAYGYSVSTRGSYTDQRSSYSTILPSNSNVNQSLFVNNPVAYFDGNLTVPTGTTNYPTGMYWYVNGDLNDLSGSSTWSGNNMVIYAKGNINMASTKFNVTGKVIIVAEGKITINGGFNFGTSNIVLMSTYAAPAGQYSVSFANGGYATNAEVYCHNAAGTASFSSTGNCKINGSIVADKVTFAGSSGMFTYAPPVYPFLPPGTGGGGTVSTNAWQAASWEILY